jgi:hypothetical protein
MRLKVALFSQVRTKSCKYIRRCIQLKWESVLLESYIISGSHFVILGGYCATISTTGALHVHILTEVDKRKED